MITVAERKEIAKLVLTTHDNKVIERIKDLVFSTNKAKEKYNKEIDEAVVEIKNGKYFTQQQADILLATWEKE